MESVIEYYLPSEIKKRFRVNKCLEYNENIEHYNVFDFKYERECELCIIRGIENCTYAKIMALKENDFEKGPIKPINELIYYRNQRLLCYIHDIQTDNPEYKVEYDLRRLFNRFYYILEWNNKFRVYSKEYIKKYLVNYNGDISLSNWGCAVWSSDVATNEVATSNVPADALQLLIWYLEEHGDAEHRFGKKLKQLFREQHKSFSKEWLIDRIGIIQDESDKS